MNKIYKVVRCQATGQSIVVSEQVKGKGKTKVKVKGVQMPIKAVLALMLGSVGSAWAACPPLVGAGASEINCYGPDEIYIANDGDSFTRLRVNATTGDGAIVLNNNTFANTTDIVTVGVTADLGNVSIGVKGNNLITSADSTTTALWAIARPAGGGEARISVDQNATLTIENKNFGSNTGDGIEVNGTSAFVEHLGSGKVTVYGGHGVFATATGINGIAEVKLGRNVVIETQGNSNNGIDAHTTSNGTIDIINDAQISTLGDSAKGIFAGSLGNNGGVTITNTGNISTIGRSSDGILVAPVTGLSGSGKITVNNSGNITTQNTGVPIGGRGAHAIYTIIDNNGTASQGIDIHQTGGTLTTTGYDSHGIFALSDAISGDINIKVSDTIIDVKHRNSDAIDVQRQSSGDINQVSNININVTTNGGEFKLLDSMVAPTGGSNFGIVAIQYDAAAGGINITNNGTKISTGKGADGSGASSDAIRASFVNNTATGNVDIMNNGELSTQAAQANTITAINNGSGTITVRNKEALSVAGNDASAIKATSIGGAGDILILHEKGATITSAGNTVIPDSRTDAINAFKDVSATGDIAIYVDGDISTNAANRGAAAYAQHQGVGNAKVIGTGNITASASYTGTNIYSYGLAATVSDSINAAGNATVGYSSGVISTAGDEGFALYAGVVGKSGKTRVENSGTLMTTGMNSSAIWARNETTDAPGKVDVINLGQITTVGDGSHGIYANLKTAGSIDIANAGEIKTAGLNSKGISAYVPTTATSADVEVVNTGNITAVSHGIVISNGAASGNSKIYVEGSRIETLGVGVGVAIVASESLVDLEVKDSQVIVHGKSGGVTASRNLNATTVNSTTVKISNSIIDGRDSYGADALTVSSGVIGNTYIHLDAKTHIYGGWKNGADVATGIGFNGLKRELINEGNIEALSDWAIRGSRFTATGAQSTIKNYGTITGYMSGDDGDSVFNNYSSNSWNIRNFADTDGDQIRDTKAVAISDFGLGNDTFKNESTGTIRLAAVTGETTIDASNEYITAGALSINNAGIVQGQLLNLNTFENRGTIDLTENNQAGDILLISGGATAGTYGGGQFISDGGRLKLDTVLNDGGVNSLSDMLVIDDSTTASGATKLYISQTGNGDLTQGEGIKVIETLGTSSSDSFALGKPVAAGLYEYILNQGSSDQNWYLSSRYNQGLPIFNPATGAYLANQSAASSLFMHTLYDRQGHANNVAGGSAEKPSVWVRAATSKSRNQSVNGMMGTKTDASLIHLGGDVAKWQNENGNLHLGLMGSYGQTDSDVTSQVTHTTAKGKVTGFALGVYGTWFADEAQGKGLYVDGWAQYGWYKNKVSGAAQVNDEEKYDSTNWTTSVEAGYGIHLHREDNTDLMLTPQVQVTYNHYSADDHKDGNNLKVSGSDASGVITRLGARMYGKAVEGYGARPYMEANWVHNTAKNELDFNGEVLKDQIPKDKGELKLGLQGTVSKNLKVWGQVGGQWGGENYERYEGQVGVNYQW